MKKENKTSTATSEPIIYSGEVTIKSITKRGKVKNVKKHNAGKLALFTFLTKALKGEITPMYRPTSIMGFDSKGDRLFTGTIPYEGLPQLYQGNSKATGSDADVNGSDAIQYTFMIPFGMILESEVAPVLHKLQFVNGFDDVCAEVTGLKYPIEIGTNIVIYWKMSFTNADTTNGGN